jgi:hypothetical protein
MIAKLEAEGDALKIQVDQKVSTVGNIVHPSVKVSTSTDKLPTHFTL